MITVFEPQKPLPYKGISLAYSMQGEMEEAEQALQDGLKHTSDISLKLAMAGLLAEQDKIEQADAIYNEIISQYSKFFPSYQAYSQWLINRGMQTEAVVLLEKALETGSAQYEIHDLLAKIYLKSGNKEEALAAINNSLAIEQEQSLAYKLLKELYLDRWEGSMKVMSMRISKKLSFGFVYIY